MLVGLMKLSLSTMAMKASYIRSVLCHASCDHELASAIGIKNCNGLHWTVLQPNRPRRENLPTIDLLAYGVHVFGSLSPEGSSASQRPLRRWTGWRITQKEKDVESISLMACKGGKNSAW